MYHKLVYSLFKKQIKHKFDRLQLYNKCMTSPIGYKFTQNRH